MNFILHLDNDKTFESSYNTRKTLGENRYSQKQTYSTRSDTNGWDSITNFKIGVASNWMQKKQDQMIIALSRNFEDKRDQFESYDSQYKLQKDKLENLKIKQEKLMKEIENWSWHRKKIEKNAIEQKLFLEKELENNIKERVSLREDARLIDEKYNNQIKKINNDLDNLREQIYEK